MFESLPGFREFLPDRCAVRNHLFRVWRQTARRYGFREYDAPILEPLELFTEKSGPEIVDQLFAFTDKGGRAVALRPELTPSLARLVGARAAGLPKPIKWFAIGEQFRYERPGKGRLRSFYQFNADILGEPGVLADAELIALCLASLEAVGLGPTDIVLRLSDRQLWVGVLELLGVAPGELEAVLRAIDKLERVTPEATRAALVTAVGEDRAERVLGAYTALRSATDGDGLAAVVAGLGAPAEGPLAARLSEWRTLLGTLEAMGYAEWVRVDLGIVRGLAYYTGFVYEVFERSGEGRALCGGGRYDGLIGKLGYAELPAAGFAIGDVTLTDALESRGRLPALVDKPDVYLVIGAGADERTAASATASALRRAGWSVEYALRETGFGKQFKAAGASGARWAVILGNDEVAAGAVKVKDLSTSTEETVKVAGLLSYLQGA